MIQTAHHVVFHNIWNDSIKDSDVQIYLVNDLQISGNDIKISGYPLTINSKDKKNDTAILKINKFFDEVFNQNSKDSNSINTEMNQFAYPLKTAKIIPKEKSDVYIVGFNTFATGVWQKFVFIDKVEIKKINISDGFIDTSKAIMMSGLVNPAASGGMVLNENGEVVAMLIKTADGGKIIGILVDNIKE